MYIIGIDPGLTGAVAIIHPDGKTIDLHDTPVNEVKKGRKNAHEYAETEMARIFYGESFILDSIAAGRIHAYVEKVHSMQGQGVTSTFNFGTGYGIWLGILAALKIPSTRVTPQAWKKEMMQGIADKDAARGRAQQLYPHKSEELSRKKDIGRADALLIAAYGRQASISRLLK